ncbi:Thioesterase/thiol ester dehydrase-isomerase [Decorospora gaudefroyi]|uniref:Thioesterase/thiol ester dehydrase-isomerase n=1 Tax=Decorospora gaudefroyi TaxID=184978 RepID=A0A6A5KAG4_9PLEO|nr:Thioesterase/thiol ester dehydrase-isomerase [Decorospora gaudefroyi]
MTQPNHKPFIEQLALRQTSENGFEMINLPQTMGNPLNIAYGGYAIAVACKAACLAVPEGYHLYSILGNYLGPAYTDRPLHASVTVIRQTRTFATRQVHVSQKRDDGESRTCLIAIADFQVKEKGVLLAYSHAPKKQYPNWKDCPTQEATFKALADDGKISKEMLDYHNHTFSVQQHLYEQRLCPTSVFAQNLYGVAKSLSHSQDAVPPPERTTADWLRCKEHLPTPIDHITNLTFLIDTAIAFLPLSFNHLWFDDVSAVSSLDFSLRIFQTEIDVNQWHLREMSAPVAGEGRSFGESWIWDEGGKAVACMSQQSILRPHRQTTKGKL